MNPESPWSPNLPSRDPPKKLKNNLQLEFTEYFFMLMKPFLKDIVVCR